jgi:hypothetical protein
MINKTSSPLPFKEATEVFVNLAATQEKTQTQEVVRRTTAEVTQQGSNARQPSLMAGITALVSVGIIVAGVIGASFLNNQAEASNQKNVVLHNEFQTISDSLEAYYDQNKAYPDQVNSLIKTAAQKTGLPVSDFCYAPQTERNNQNYVFGARVADNTHWEARITAINDGKLESVHSTAPNCFD